MRKTTLILLLLCIFAFGAAMAVACGVFQAVPHLEDEHANLFQAKVLATGKLYASSPAQPGVFFVPFVLDWEGRRFSKYPPGYSAMLALGVLTRTPWFVNPLLGALALVATFALGRAIFGDDQTALLAAILGATSPMFLGLSSALLSHALSLLLLTVFAWAFLRSTLHTPALWASTLHALLAGFSLGWAALTRPMTAIAYAAPFGLWALWRVAGRRSRPGPLVVTALVAGAMAALLPLYQWTLTGSYSVNLYATWWGYDSPGFGPGHGPLPEGHSLASALHNSALDLASLLTDMHGWPGLSWVLIAPGLLMAPRDRRDVALLAPLAALALAYGFYWVRGSGIYGPRYWYEATPFLWLLSARGLIKLWDWAQGRGRVRSWIKLGLAALIALNVTMTMPARFAFWRGLYFVTNEPWRAVQQANLHNALVIVRGKLWMDYGAVLWANSPSLDDDVVFARDQGEAVNAAVIAQYPGRRVFWMEETQLIPVRPDGS
jgi:4-amino-4-deoxy-L-arabinose transferase-like glycosyltransferase